MTSSLDSNFLKTESEALLLLATLENIFLVKCQGPFEVLRHVGLADYTPSFLAVLTYAKIFSGQSTVLDSDESCTEFKYIYFCTEKSFWKGMLPKQMLAFLFLFVTFLGKDLHLGMGHGHLVAWCVQWFALLAAAVGALVEQGWSPHSCGSLGFGM